MSYKKITLIFCLGIFLSSERPVSAQTMTRTFSFVSDTFQTWTVPSCVSAATIQMWGGGGGGGNYNNSSGYEFAGGSGAYYQGVLTGISPGMAVNLYVPSGGLLSSNSVGGLGGWPGGAQGGNDVNYGEYGGGGGGYAAVKINGIVYMVCGAGGGGGSWPNEDCHGGPGGGPNGGSGGPSAGTAAQGGTLSAGGAPGSSANACDPGLPGTQYYGGHGGGTSCSGYYGGGGGGAGYYGGGGAGDYAGGGGGGSSFPGTSFSAAGVTATMLTNTVGNGGSNAAVYAAPGNPPATIGQGGYIGNNNGNGGNGYIVVTYTTDSVGSASGNVVKNIVCNGNATGVASILVNNVAGGAAFTYTWMPSGGSKDTATGLTAGTYIVNVTGCGSASATVTITQPTFFAPNPTINAPLCHGDTGNIIAGAIGGTLPYTFVFTPGGQVPAIYGLTSGTYSLNILDNHGCATSELITVSQPAAVVASASQIAAPNCYGSNSGIAIVSVTGGVYPYAYAWSPSGGSNLTASNLAAGNYVVTVTDANGCVQNAPVTLTQPAYLGVMVNPPLLNLACNGDNNGVLGSGVSGGIRPYTYAWSGGLGNDSDVMNLSAGTYSLTVTDAHGCITVDSALVIQPAPMNATVQSTFDDGHCTGSAWVVLSGGTPSYNYLWSAGSVTFYQNDLCAGESYCCTITDANGCQYNTCTIIQSSLGVGNISGGDSKIKVYPNPNNGQFTVESTVANAQWTVEVYNMLGEKLYTQASNGNSQMTVNMSAQPGGTYLYRVISNEDGNLLGTGKVEITK